MTYELTKDERREIQLTFRECRGDRLSKQQRKLLKHYRVSYSFNSTHAYFEIDGTRIPVSISPSSRYAGRKIGTDLINLLEGNLNRNG